ncbi:phage major capsid protein [Brevundimonas phoenicis]|uniref:phage major capsid protein n=1 Tax=unclassified Brevundimonas TaxID=2622653 RepID=UPI0039AF49B6
MNLTLETKNAPEPDDDGEVKAALDDLTKAANEKAAENKAAVDAEIKALRGEIAALKRPGAQTDDEPSEEAKAFGSYLRQADRSPEIKTLTVSSDPQGGYLAPAEFGTEFLKDLIELSPLRALASIRSISSSSVTYPTRIGITNATWHGETEERTESEPAFGQKEVHSRQISTWVPISNQLLADSGGTVEAEVRAALADDFAQKEGVAYLLGDGQLQPEGLLVNKDVAVVKTGHASTLGSAPADMLVRRQRLWHRSGVADNGGIGSRRSDVRNADETQSLQPKIGCQAHQEARRGGGERYSPCHTPAFLGRG